MALPHVRIMSRRQCCLCDEMKAVVEMLAGAGHCSWETVDVDRDKGLLVRYGMDVPVLLIDGEEAFRHRVAPDDLRRALQTLTDGVQS